MDINYLFCLKLYSEWYWFFLESQSKVNTLIVVCVSNYCHYNYNEFRQKATRLQSRRKALVSGFLWSATGDQFLSKKSMSKGTESEESSLRSADPWFERHHGYEIQMYNLQKQLEEFITHTEETNRQDQGVLTIMDGQPLLSEARTLSIPN